jgi:hypothetical protein
MFCVRDKTWILTRNVARVTRPVIAEQRLIAAGMNRRRMN